MNAFTMTYRFIALPWILDRIGWSMNIIDARQWPEIIYFIESFIVAIL